MKPIQLHPELVDFFSHPDTDSVRDRHFQCPVLGEVSVFIIGAADYAAWPTLPRQVVEVHCWKGGVQAFDTHTTTIHSSHGEITFEQGQGMVIANSLSAEFVGHPIRFDVAEWQRAWLGEPLEEEGDILDYGYWTVDGEYVEADDDYRRGVRDAEREAREASDGPEQMMKVVSRNADYWLKAAREAENQADAVMCAEQAINAYKNAAYDFSRRLADRGI